MVSQLVDSFTAAREWRLLILIDNAKHSVRGIELERELAAIRGQLVLELEDSLDKEPNPAEVAQFYLFDLHNPCFSACSDCLIRRASRASCCRRRFLTWCRTSA